MTSSLIFKGIWSGEFSQQSRSTTVGDLTQFLIIENPSAGFQVKTFW
jgi:hypothetical protein